MIGQTKLIKVLYNQIAAGVFPHFSIFVGARGSGKRQLVGTISKKMDVPVYYCDVSVSDIREAISEAYRITSPIIFLIADADNMRIEAWNALLKVTEEPPNNAYFIITLTNVGNTLDTIRSRASVYNMEAYSRRELEQYLVRANLDLEPGKLDEYILDLCDTPGEIATLLHYDVNAFFLFVRKVVENIRFVTDGNALKISDSISLKDGSDGYDFQLFLKAFMLASLSVMQSGMNDNTDYVDLLWYLEAMQVTGRALIIALRYPSVSRYTLFDDWIIQLRELSSDGDSVWSHFQK